MNYIQYKVEIPSFPLPNKFIHKYDSEYVIRVEIEQESNNLLDVRFYFTDKVNDKERARNFTNDLLGDILHIVSYRFSISYNSIPIAYYSDGNRYVYGTASSTTLGLKQIIGDFSSELSDSLKNSKFIKELNSNPYHIFLRKIMLIDDTIAKFLLLYSLLALINGDKQKRVEKFIAEHDPNNELMTRKRTDGTEETKSVYTSLRNKVGHVTDKEEIHTIITGMERTMNSLISLVKKAIEQTY
ncbi:hypothetical protein [Bacillus coreaensis]